MENSNKIIYLADYIQNQTSIQTLKNRSALSLKKPQSHLLRKFTALALDFAAILLIKMSVDIAYAVFVNNFFLPVNFSHRAGIINGHQLIHLSVFTLIYFTYFFYTAYIFDGKTLGKMTMRLTVIDQSFLMNRHNKNYKISLAQAFKRAMGYLFCYFSFGTFFIFNFASEDHRGLADYLSSSRTVSDEWLNYAIESKEYDHQQLSIDISSLKKLAAA